MELERYIKRVTYVGTTPWTEQIRTVYGGVLFASRDKYAVDMMWEEFLSQGYEPMSPNLEDFLFPSLSLASSEDEIIYLDEGLNWEQ